MKTPFFFISIFSILFTAPAHATLHISAVDAQTGEMAHAYSSSNANGLPISVIHKKGILGEGGGLCTGSLTQTPDTLGAKILNMSTTADNTIQNLIGHCGDEGYWRATVVLNNGEIGSHIAQTGCSSSHAECGMRNGKDFSTAGGGLQTGVLNTVQGQLEGSSGKGTLYCRAFNALAAAHAAGGETWGFHKAAIVYDDPKANDFILIQTTGDGKPESLIPSLREKMRAAGLVCD